MRFSVIAFSVLSLMLFATSANAQDSGKGKGKGKRSEAEKVEVKDLPAAVTEAAKKELPNASFTSAEKYSQKKLGTVYTLEGKDGKYAVSLMLTSSGELERMTKSREQRKKKAA